MNPKRKIAHLDLKTSQKNRRNQKKILKNQMIRRLERILLSQRKSKNHGL
jgi:hypothetical protein